MNTNSSPVPVIAIDGPSASGKGTVAQHVAEKLGFHYLDSGALYRLVALAALQSGVPLDDETRLADVAVHLDVRFENGEILLSGNRVTDDIRAEEYGNGASKIAAFPRVRQAPGLVADGRDMGSTVFPDAALKIFLDASPEVRAERRYKQLMGKGLHASIDILLQDIRARDERDSQRSVAPLQMGADASLLDTTPLTIEQAVNEVLKRFQDSSPR
jgi:cytidylate kinase